MLENWYELARTIPGHNATVFETCQLEIYEISAFLKATQKNFMFGFVFLHDSCCRLACKLKVAYDQIYDLKFQSTASIQEENKPAIVYSSNSSIVY